MEKFSTADRGNGLRALARLRPGELLFRSDPLAYTVCKGSRGVVCDRCLLGKEKLMRCSQCRVAKYCSAKCQDADMLTGDEQVWKEVQESLKKIEELKAHWKWEQVLAMCQTIISSNAERLPDINIYQLKVLDCAMDACINLGLLEEALFYGMRTMEPYRIFSQEATLSEVCKS